MQFNVITLFPNMITQCLSEGVVAQGFIHGLMKLNVINPRDFTHDTHQSVDDRPFGGGDGMVLMIDPLRQALESVPDGQRGEVIYLSPRGERFSSCVAQKMSQKKQLTLVCGRYEGVDQRFIDAHVDREISLGDYVLSGGELGAMVMVDAIARFIPNVLGNPDSAYQESFSSGLLEAPHYTRPQVYGAQSTPEVLLSGNHKKNRSMEKAPGPKDHMAAASRFV